MKRAFSILAAAGLLLAPLVVQSSETAPQSSQEIPPVAQTLVREGDFAVKLAADLELSTTDDEATAENMLATAGVAPANGWISDYPVTPQIVGQLDDAIVKASADGRLKMNAEQASAGMHRLVAELNLPEPAGKNPSSSAEPPAAPAVINNYYYNEGPPIMTYYAPPADYVYLYDWVPYPVFWFGFWFPGFYICHNFTTTVVVSRPFLYRNATYVSGTAIVSNRFIDPATRRVVAVDPVVRTSTGAIRPLTTLRGRNGRSFMTLADMRSGTALRGVNPIRTESGFRGQGRFSGSFESQRTRMSANAIYSRSLGGVNSRNAFSHAPSRDFVQGGRRGSGAFSGSSTFTENNGSFFREPGRTYNYGGTTFGDPGSGMRTFDWSTLRSGSGAYSASRGRWR